MLKTLYASCAILFLLLSAATAEQWYFLPNYRHDVRGIENAFREGKGFHKRIPSGLAHLRSPDGDLTEEELQKLTDKKCKELDDLTAKKEAELMAV